MSLSNRARMLALLAALATFAAVAVVISLQPAEAGFPGDNGRIAYAADGDIFTVNSDGSDPQNITDTPNVIEDNPEYDPEGLRIVFESTVGGTNAASREVFFTSASGEGRQRLTNSDGVNNDPTFSADGQKVAFVSSRPGSQNADVYTLEIDDPETEGAETAVQFTDSPGDDFHPTWSPDGTDISFTSTRTGGGDLADIYKQGVDDNGASQGDATQLTTDPAFDFNSNYSPDGERLTFASNGRTNNLDVFVVSDEGESAEAPALNITEDSTAGEFEPAFSPEGDEIVFERNGQMLFIRNADGTDTSETERSVSRNRTGEAAPDWGVFTECEIVGTEDGDELDGDEEDNVICGLGGDDTLIGNGGGDTLLGGDGDDETFGGEGDDELLGEAGNDTIGGGPGDDTLRGGEGDDLLAGADGGDTAIGNEGNDVVSGGDGGDTLLGQEGNDRVFGGEGLDALFGGVGADFISGQGGRDTLYGQDGGDSLDGGAGPDRLLGQQGQDGLVTRDGVEGNDSANGGVGIDFCDTDLRDQRISCERP